MQHQRLNNETAEHYELFVMFCEFEGSVEQFYNAIKPNLTLSAIQKIASPKRNNWLSRKKAFIEFSNSSKGIEIKAIKNNLLNRIKQLTEKPEMINMQNIEVLTNCFYKLTLIDCETKTEITTDNNTQKSDTVQNKPQSNKNIPKPKENATVPTVSNIFDKNGKPTRLKKENNEMYDLFCRFVEFDGGVNDFAKSVCNELNVSWATVKAYAGTARYNWTARKKEFLENKK